MVGAQEGQTLMRLRNSIRSGVAWLGHLSNSASSPLPTPTNLWARDLPSSSLLPSAIIANSIPAAAAIAKATLLAFFPVLGLPPSGAYAAPPPAAAP